jgi:hypothetical protein
LKDAIVPEAVITTLTGPFSLSQDPRRQGRSSCRRIVGRHHHRSAAGLREVVFHIDAVTLPFLAYVMVKPS